jgi:hypothetical protein
VRPSLDIAVLVGSSGLDTPATSGSPASACNDASMTPLCWASVKVPLSVWKTIGLASDSSAENDRPMMSVAAALSEPETVTVLEYFVPAAWLANTRPMSTASHPPMTSARCRAE